MLGISFVEMFIALHAHNATEFNLFQRHCSIGDGAADEVTHPF